MVCATVLIRSVAIATVAEHSRRTANETTHRTLDEMHLNETPMSVMMAVAVVGGGISAMYWMLARMEMHFIVVRVHE